MGCWLGFLVRQQFLRRLLDLLEQPSMIAGLIDRGLELLAEFCQTLQPLLLGERLIESVLQGHAVPSRACDLVIAPTEN